MNWVGGRKLNKQPLNPLATKPVKARKHFIYRARHRFLSLPMELWSVAMSIFGLGLIVRGLVQG